MNTFEGAPLKDAFKIIGDGSKKTMKEKDKVVPRDSEPNDLNKINFQENMKFVVERYDKIINSLIDEINVLKKYNNKNLIEGYSNSLIPQLTEKQVNDLIYLLFAGIFIVMFLNYINK